MAYQLSTRKGKTKFGMLLIENETIPSLKERFYKVKFSEKEIFEKLKEDSEITITEIDLTKPASISATVQTPKTTEAKKPKGE